MHIHKHRHIVNNMYTVTYRNKVEWQKLERKYRMHTQLHKHTHSHKHMTNSTAIFQVHQ